MITKLNDNQLLHQATRDRIDLSTSHRIPRLQTSEPVLGKLTPIDSLTVTELF